MQERRPQVECQWKFNGAFFARRIDLAGSVAVIDKPGQPFYDKKADEALFSVLEGVLRHRRYRTR